MKKIYDAPELEIMRFMLDDMLSDVILTSREGDVTEYFGNGDDVIDDDLMDP